MSIKLYVLCGPAVLVPASLVQQPGEGELTVRYLHQKTEHEETYVLSESFTFQSGTVTVSVPKRATGPCTLPLPSPFNQLLKCGTTLLFTTEPSVDMAFFWNECCGSSVTWQHSRPKKATDPLQKLGLPPKLAEFLCERVKAFGINVPEGSDISDEEDAVIQEEKGSDQSSHSSSESSEDKAESDYYSSALDEDDGEDLEEEEEIEEEPEPEELLDDE